MKKKRSIWGLIFDFVMTILTGGLWLAWIFIRDCILEKENKDDLG